MELEARQKNLQLKKAYNKARVNSALNGVPTKLYEHGLKKRPTSVNN